MQANDSPCWGVSDSGWSHSDVTSCFVEFLFRNRIKVLRIDGSNCLEQRSDNSGNVVQYAKDEVKLWCVCCSASSSPSNARYFEWRPAFCNKIIWNRREQFERREKILNVTYVKNSDVTTYVTPNTEINEVTMYAWTLYAKYIQQLIFRLRKLFVSDQSTFYFSDLMDNGSASHSSGFKQKHKNWSDR